MPLTDGMTSFPDDVPASGLPVEANLTLRSDDKDDKGPALTEEFWRRVYERAATLSNLRVSQLLSIEKADAGDEDSSLTDGFWEAVCERAETILDLPVSKLLAIENGDDNEWIGAGLQATVLSHTDTPVDGTDPMTEVTRPDPHSECDRRRAAVNLRHRSPHGGGQRDQQELVVLSHHRWTFVWQRPQQIISRLATTRRTWFVEEPVAVEVLTEPRLRTEVHGDVCRVWLEVPGPDGHVCFSDPRAAGYAAELTCLLGPDRGRMAWLYTPMALSLAEALAPRTLVYDVMDDMASFKGAPPQLELRQRQTLKQADVVFTDGRSLHRSVVQRRPEGTHCFPGGVDPDHYAPAIAMRRSRALKVAGYVGVIDERLDLELIADLAAALPDWQIRIVGPVVKIDPATLPRARNITYLGAANYPDLPAVMAGFDVGLMPFAFNQATRSISATKTLEYLAAGLPVVSTRIPDVVADFGELVDLQDDAPDFADACRRLADHSADARAAKAEPMMYWYHWDSIVARMERVIDDIDAAHDQGFTQAGTDGIA